MGNIIKACHHCEQCCRNFCKLAKTTLKDLSRQENAAKTLHVLHLALGFTTKTMSVPAVMQTKKQGQTCGLILTPSQGIHRAVSNALHFVIITRTVFFIIGLGFFSQMKWKAPDGLFTRDFVLYMLSCAVAITGASVCASIQYNRKAIIATYNAINDFRSRFSRMERACAHF